MRIKDITLPMLQEICDIINRGNQVEIKKERTNVVIVEIERHALSKNPIE